jgi:uncharacterized SAM-binding protein YcdF (DUF218 family)
MGKPVVSTELPEIKRINAEAADIIATASDAQGFVRAIERALNDGSDEARTQRVALARSNAWDTRVSEMSTLIEQAGATREANENASWEQKLRRIYRVARRRLAITAVAAIVLIVVLFYTPVFWLVAGPLKLSETPRPVDAIVVFAGGVGESGTAGGGYQERVKQAVDLYHQGHAANLVFSSGFSFVFREAELMRDLAVSLGVPTEAVILETKAANTHENVRFVSRILEDQDWNEALLVSSPYHMRRAVLVWRRAAPDIAVTPTPVPRSQFYAHGAMDGATVVQMNGILHEYAAIISYWWRGWI